MITPNKLVAFEDSVLATLHNILDRGPGQISVRELFKLTESKFESADQFMLALDVLYLLGRIDISEGTVIYAD